MSEVNSLVADLQKEIVNSRMWNADGVSNDRLESLIRKHTVTEPMKVAHASSAQYEIRGGYVDAKQHDGSDESASEIADWVIRMNGKVRVFAQGSLDYDLDNAYIKIDSPRSPDVIGPGWWCVRSEDGFFFAVSDTDFRIVYVPRVS